MISSLNTKKAKLALRIFVGLIFLLLIIYIFLHFMNFLVYYPKMQVNQLNTNINNSSLNNTLALANLENQYRVTLLQIFATIAQIIGGFVLLLGLYFTWKNIIVIRESQITERFTRAVDQLGNRKIEIRLGGIYALERIADDSEKDYWPIIEILTAFIRENSSIENIVNKTEIENHNEESQDIQAILTVIRRRKYYFKAGESHHLNLQKTNLQNAHLEKAHLEGANLESSKIKESCLVGAHLEEANLMWTNLGGADLKGANLKNANLQGANLRGASLIEANLSVTNLRGAHLEVANLEKADLFSANLEGANLFLANLEGANLAEVNLKDAKNLSPEQLSNVKTLYNTKLDEGLLMQLKAKYYTIFEKPKDYNN